MPLNDPHLFWMLIAGCAGLFLVVSVSLVVVPMFKSNITGISEIRSLIFIQALIVGLVLVPTGIGGMFYHFTLGAVLARGVWEIHELIHGSKLYKKYILSLCMACLFVPILVSYSPVQVHVFILFAIVLVSLLLAPRYSFGLHAISLIVLLMSIEGLLFLGRAENTLLLITLVYFIIETFDCCAYLVGQSWGRHKVFPKISPGKTWEGYIGGTLCSGLFATALNYFIYGIAWFEFFGWVSLILVAGVCGDILTSLLKRQFSRKDFSPLIVLHGGMLDIYDAFLFAVIAFSMVYFI